MPVHKPPITRRQGKSARARLTALAAMTWLFSCVEYATMADEPAPVDFASTIRPIFERNCFKCHGAEKQRGGLRLDVRESVLAGGDSGEPAVVPGKVESSALLERVSSDKDDRRMPPKGKRLSVDEVSLLRRWVAAGASWPAEAKGAAVTRGRSAMVVTEADRDHWSFRPLRPISPPRTRAAGAVSNPIDDFLNTARKAKNLTPAPDADRQTLIRRVTFDLIGLPPDFDDVTAFAGDRSPDAYERVVDRLLASPQYGERWGRHWLDLARYADSDGYESDLDRKTAYRYRDFVIHALNDDMPFDQFVRWQIAGDELEPGNPVRSPQRVSARRRRVRKRRPLIRRRTRRRFVMTSWTTCSRPRAQPFSASRSAVRVAMTTSSIRFPRAIIIRCWRRSPRPGARTLPSLDHTATWNDGFAPSADFTAKTG